MNRTIKTGLMFQIPNGAILLAIIIYSIIKSGSLFWLIQNSGLIGLICIGVIFLLVNILSFVLIIVGLFEKPKENKKC